MDNIEVLLHQLDEELTKSNINDFYQDSNIFRILKIEGNEIRHSNFLAWLVNPNANHGLKDLVLKKFFSYLCFTHDFDTSDVIVEREKLHIDLLIYSPKGKWFIVIENKTWTVDHNNQLNRYSEEIEDYLPNYQGYFLYLTPSGEEPVEDYDRNKWKIVGYQFIKDAIKESLAVSKVDDRNRIYIEDYIKILEESLLMEKDKELRDLCLDIYSKHKDAIDTINRYVGDIASMRSKAIYDALKNKEDELNITLGVSTNKYTRFISNDIKLLTGQLGNERWGSGNKDLLLYEISFDKNTDSLKIQVVVGPGEVEPRNKILTKFKENKSFYSAKGLKRNEIVDGWVWVKELSVIDSKDFEGKTNEEVAIKLIEYLNSDKFIAVNKAIVKDVKEALF